MSDQNDVVPKKTLFDWIDEFYDDTATLSSIVRNLAFAGIAIIWIFKNPGVGCDSLPKKEILGAHLKPPLIFLISGLILDVIQYLYRSVTIYICYLILDHRRKSKPNIDSVEMPDFIRIGTWIFFWLKIVSIVIAYVLIFRILSTRL